MSDQSIDMEMAMAMGEEDLLEFQMEDTEQITEQMDEMRKTYKKIGKLCKAQHHNFREISHAITMGDNINQMADKIMDLRLEIFTNLETLGKEEEDFRKLTKGTKFENINLVSTKPNVTTRRVNEDGKISHSCTVCDYSRATMGAVQKHMLNEHQLGSFKCNLCNYKTGNSHSLYVHMKTTHDIPMSIKLCL